VLLAAWKQARLASGGQIVAFLGHVFARRLFSRLSASPPSPKPTTTEIEAGRSPHTSRRFEILHSRFGIQTWVALPEAQEDAQPSFKHHGKETLPLVEGDGAARARARAEVASACREPASTSAARRFGALR
jgi:hypothetical protein